MGLIAVLIVLTDQLPQVLRESHALGVQEIDQSDQAVLQLD
jgi:hypothetical protein